MAIKLKRANFNGKNGAHFFLDLYQDNSQNQNSNVSPIRYYAYVGSVDGYSGSGASAPVRINGTIVGYFSSIPARSNTLVGYLDVVVQHDDQGRGVASYSASADTNWTLGDASLSGSFNLPTIPRASQPTATSANIGDAITIYTNRKSSAFTHTLKYSFGSLSGTIATGVTDSSAWTLPSTFYAQIPNSSYGTGTITCLSLIHI